MDERIVSYFKLIINSGLNIKKGQKMIINCPVECAEYARIAMQEAYDAGAKQVIIRWRDEKSTKITYLNAEDSIFDVADPWHKVMLNTLANEGVATLSIASEDPELMKDVPIDRIMRSTKAMSKAIKIYRDKNMSNENRWCVASIPSEAWAKKVFPKEKSAAKAIDKLWDAILKCSRVEVNAVEAWNTHTATLLKRAKALNKYDFEYIHLKSSNGTDLKIELPKDHIWAGGQEEDNNGIPFCANIPTEEVFTAPKKTGVNGVVKNSKPFVYNGNIIDNFTVWFENGKAVKCEASQNEDLLKQLLDTDAGASYLGEIALVPYHSPISESNILFYNTLFDENASCHLAFGKAYPTSVKDAVGKNAKGLAKLGINDSRVHEDFMIGTADMDIIGVTKKGKNVQIFKDGDFAF